MKVAMIWAQDVNGVLGNGREMLWHVPGDFKHFKATTLGYPVIMGRGSWEALGGKPLSGRLNVVITGQEGYEAEGAEVAHSLEQAVAVARTSAELVWIVGGARVYAEAMSVADELVVTDLDLEVAPAPDLVYAPTIDAETWQADSERSDVQWRPQSGDARWKVTTYVRRRAA